MIDMCRALPDGENAQQVLDLIRSRGWAIEHLDQPDDRTPTLTSTVGLCLRGHPEFMVIGGDPLEGFALLEPLALAVDNGRRFFGADNLTGLYAGPERIELINLMQSDRFLPTVNKLFRRAGTAPIPALLLIRPDYVNPLAGRFAVDAPEPTSDSDRFVGATLMSRSIPVTSGVES
jgi:hypothetical protein